MKTKYDAYCGLYCGACYVMLANEKGTVEEVGKDKKQISIRTYTMVIDELDNLVIEIKDNGIGIQEQMHDEVFLPFVTTKEAGKGTGLGLSIVRRIVEEHDGKIEFESEVGKGTLFRIFLPILDSDDSYLQ